MPTSYAYERGVFPGLSVDGRAAFRAEECLEHISIGGRAFEALRLTADGNLICGIKRENTEGDPVLRWQSTQWQATTAAAGPGSSTTN